MRDLFERKQIDKFTFEAVDLGLYTLSVLIILHLYLFDLAQNNRTCLIQKHCEASRIKVFVTSYLQPGKWVKDVNTKHNYRKPGKWVKDVNAKHNYRKPGKWVKDVNAKHKTIDRI